MSKEEEIVKLYLGKQSRRLRPKRHEKKVGTALQKKRQNIEKSAEEEEKDA